MIDDVLLSDLEDKKFSDSEYGELVVSTRLLGLDEGYIGFSIYQKPEVLLGHVEVRQLYDYLGTLLVWLE